MKIMIYKYYPSNNYTYEALEEGYFYFNKVSRQNDPFDASFKLLQANFLLDELKRKGLPDNTENIMKDYAACSFSHLKDNKHMWTFYAKDYFGLVIGFDEEQFLHYQNKFQTRIPLLEVNYVEKPITDDDLSDSFELRFPLEDKLSYRYTQCFTDEKALEALFYLICCMKEKATWSMEKELRLIAALDVLNNQNRLTKLGFKYSDNGYKIPIPPNCVKEIILGHNFSNENILRIKNIAKKYGIKEIQQTKLGMPFEMEFEKINIEE